jgi:hypothetical protein
MESQFIVLGVRGKRGNLVPCKKKSRYYGYFLLCSLIMVILLEKSYGKWKVIHSS